MDSNPSDSSVHGISEARLLEWLGISFSRESSQPRDPAYVSWVSCIGRHTLYHCTTISQSSSWWDCVVCSGCSGVGKKKWLRATDVIAEGKKAWRFTGVRADAFVRMPVFVFLFWSLACGILVPPWGIDPVPSALGTLNLSHWTTREVRMSIFCPSFRFPRNYPFLGRLELYAFLQSSELIWCKLYIVGIQKNLYGAHKECTKGTDDVFYPQASISLQNSYAASKNT